MSVGIIDECYQRSVELLKRNSCRYGVLAASISTRAVKRNYLSIFARDASICVLGMSASKDKDLMKLAKRSLVSLGSAQDKFGQIPNYIQPERKLKNYWVLGSIDASLWWLIAIYFFNLNTNNKQEKYYPEAKIKKAINWLNCHVSPTDGLLVQPEASGWADIMPRSGKVLYTNVLWLAVKKFYKIKDYKKVKENFDLTFYPFGKTDRIERQANSLRPTLRELSMQKGKGFYLSFVNYLYWGQGIDVYGNVLAIVFDVADETMKEKILAGLEKKQNKKTLPIPVMYNPIKERSKLWRKYMESHNQNLPYQYHNGGIWPFVSAFYALALVKEGRSKQAVKEITKVALANSKNDWEFNEWFHGLTGRSMGMHGQSWNAGAYIFAQSYLREK